MNKNQKQAVMQELTLLTDPVGWESDPVTVERVEVLGRLLGADNISESSPLPDLDFEKFTVDNFLYLKSLGYGNDYLMEVCGVQKNKFNYWIRDNELSRQHLSREELQFWEFPSSAKKLPLKGEKTMAIITKEKINEFLQDGGWKVGTQNSYRSFLSVFMNFMDGAEITTKKVDTFLHSYIQKEISTKRSNIKSVLLKYLKWIDFDYNERQERVVEVVKKSKPVPSTVPLTFSNNTCQEKGAETRELRVLEKSEKICVMVGKAFLDVDPEEQAARISLDHEKASDLSEKKETARQIAADYGGRLVKVRTVTSLAEVD
ncbi:hypothetical protein ACYSNR_01045 [Enterococcus sp. LJL128]